MFYLHKQLLWKSSFWYENVQNKELTSTSILCLCFKSIVSPRIPYQQTSTINGKYVGKKKEGGKIKVNIYEGYSEFFR